MIFGPFPDDDDGGAPAEVDPYDLMDPVDILAKVPKDYYEKIVSIFADFPLTTASPHPGVMGTWH